MQRRWLTIQAALLLLILLILPPYRGQKLALPDASRFVSLHHVISALGLHYRGVYPAYSLDVRLPLEDLVKKNPDIMLKRDLREAVPEKFWPPSYNDIFWAVGGDAGMAFAIYHLWKFTGHFTFGAIVNALIVFHLLAVAAFFVLLTRLNLKWLPLLGALMLAYSPPIIKNIYGVSVYVTVVFATVIATTLAIFALPKMTKRELPFGIRVTLAIFAGIILAAGGALRSTTRYALWPLVIIAACTAFSTKRRREALIPLLFIVGCFATSGLIHSRIWTPEALAMNQQTHLAPWHVMWVGLGEFPNPHGFVHQDEAGFQFAQKEKPDVVFYSSAYLDILRRHMVTTFLHNPFWFFALYCKRLWIVAGHWLRILPLVGDLAFSAWLSRILLVAGVGAAVFFGVTRRHWKSACVLLPFLAFLAVPIVVISSYDFYNLPAYVGLATTVLFGLASVSHLFSKT